MISKLGKPTTNSLNLLRKANVVFINNIYILFSFEEKAFNNIYRAS
jgi:hypothetical protein